MKLIDADKALEIANEYMWSQEVADFEFVFNKCPTIDAVPVVHGRWEYTHPFETLFCSNCRQIPRTQYESEYCPNCGARMK